MKRRVMLEEKNTLLLCHFDNSYIDECGSEYLIDTPSNLYFTTGKFNNALTSKIGEESFVGYRKIDPYNSVLTIECFVKISNNSSNHSIRMGCKSGSIDNYCQFGINFHYGGTLKYIIGNSSLSGWASIIDTGRTIYNDDSYHHVAITLNKNICNLFIDGILLDNRSVSINNVGNLATYCEALVSNGHCIDELRISNTILYSSNFTPPTKPY